MSRWLRLAAFFVWCLSSVGLGRTAERGVLDLTQWDFANNGALTLSGGWGFYWRSLLSEEPAKAGEAPTTFRNVPGFWNRPDESGQSFPLYGYASYRLLIKTGRPQQIWSLDTGSMFTAGRIFVNGELLATSGIVGRDKASTTFHFRGGLVTFKSESPDLDVLVEIANFDHSKAGMGRFRFGTASAIQAERETRTGLHLFVIGGIGLMILYHFALFVLRPEEKAPIYFAASALTNCLFHLISGGWLGHWWPSIGGELWWDLFYTTWYLGFPSFSLFMWSLYPQEFSRRFLQVSIVLPFASIAFVWLTPWVVSEKSALVIQLFGFVHFIYLMWVAWKAHRHGRSHALIFITGASLYFVTIVHDIMSSEGLIDQDMNSYFGLCSFIFFQSYMIAARFSAAFTTLGIREREIRDLNEGLERKVEEKTRDIRSILAVIKQGIFTIGRRSDRGLRIQLDYSKHLESMLKTADIVDHDPLDLLFRNSDLNAEQKMMIRSILEASLGEDLVNFDLNSSHLPQEFRRIHSLETEVWEIDWTPVPGSTDLVEKVLVSLRDVSSLRQLQDEAVRQQKELEYISEIVNVTAANFQKFMKMARSFLDENERLIRLNGSKQLEVVKILFINMHTIKGNARSYQFRKMSGLLHEVEQDYAELLNNPEAVWDQPKLIEGLLKVKSLIDRYVAINRDKLGRSASENQVSIERSVVADKFNSLKLVNVDTLSSKDRTIIEDTKSTFKSLFYNKSIDVLEDVLGETERLARDLKKNNPVTTINDPGFSLPQETQELFRSVFTLIVRNSLDHGIETPVERISQGKRPTGAIQLDLYQEGRQLVVTYRDDGRGLNLAKLAQLGHEKGFLEPGAPIAVTEVANLIFYAGLSTSSSVTEISGRGVGMDAVKRYIEGMGGTIELRLDRPQDSRLDYRAFSFEIRLPEPCYAA